MRLVSVVGFSVMLGVLLSAQTKQATPPVGLPAKGSRTFTGRVTDSMCSNADHKGMRMGDTDAECTKACVLSHGAEYVLFDGTNVYTFGDQRVPEKFAGMKVSVVGVLDAKTSKIEKMSSIKAVK